jgi:hypothetical protein
MHFASGDGDVGMVDAMSHPRILQIVCPQARLRETVIPVIPDLEQAKVLRTDSKGGFVSQTNFSQQLLVSAALVESQREPTATCRQSLLIAFESNTDNEWSSTRHQVIGSYVKRGAKPMQPDRDF